MAYKPGKKPNNKQLMKVAALYSQGRHFEALHLAEQVLAGEPGNIDFLSVAVASAQAIGLFEEAEKHCRQLLALRPEDAAARYNLGLFLRARGCLAEAESCWRETLSINPNYADAHNNLGSLLHLRKCFGEAEQCYRNALAIKPGHGNALLNLCYLLLCLGKFEEGWRLHEMPANSVHKLARNAMPQMASPQWQGESLAGKSLLIWPEQGFGDEIQFCRYLPTLKRQGAKKIVLVCKDPLKPLLATLAGVDEVLGQGDFRAVPEHDYWSFLLSLPWHCKTTLDTIPAELPYLHALPGRVGQWAPKLGLAGGRLRVGLVWKGSHLHKNDANRSLPSLRLLAPLWDCPAVSFFSLQKGQGEEEGLRPPPSQPIIHLGSDMQDFADTAAIVWQLDLVICVDTAVAHLAGALGKPCWVMLPYVETDWRWLQGRSDSPWYPGVMRLFRQQAAGDWASVVDEVAAELQAWRRSL